MILWKSHDIFPILFIFYLLEDGYKLGRLRLRAEASESLWFCIAQRIHVLPI